MSIYEYIICGYWGYVNLCLPTTTLCERLWPDHKLYQPYRYHLQVHLCNGFSTTSVANHCYRCCTRSSIPRGGGLRGWWVGFPQPCPTHPHCWNQRSACEDAYTQSPCTPESQRPGFQCKALNNWALRFTQPLRLKVQFDPKRKT